MAYAVNISLRAERDLGLLCMATNAADSRAARKWYLGLRDAILSLGENPGRCPRTKENPRLRHLLYGRKPYVYRVIYSVEEKHTRVIVLHIRHGARNSTASASTQRTGSRGKSTEP